MYIRKKTKTIIFASFLSISSVTTSFADDIDSSPVPSTETTIAKQLGWAQSNKTFCGGYYVEPPFHYADELAKHGLIEIISDQALIAMHGTSTAQGKITVTRLGQQVVANKVYLYRDPETGKLSAMDLFGNVNLREPETLVIASKAHLDLTHKTQSLNNILYRSTIYSNTKARPKITNNQILQEERQIDHLSARGAATRFVQNHPNVYEFYEATYSTCPPENIFWQVKAKSITLDKNTGRGTARHARLYIKNTPVLYTPYLNFPIDKQRKTGFLAPQIGSSNKLGPSFALPFYWNLAPNYDTTITPTISEKRALLLTNLSRYLTETSNGKFKIGVLPHDKEFQQFQSETHSNPNVDPSQFQANLRSLQNASSVRAAVSWQHQQLFNDHWSSIVDYNYVSDDYYLRDIGHNLNEVTDNQLLQQAELDYKGQYWNFIGRIQQYQTLHPIDVNTTFQNQYSRFPQLVLTGNYPGQPFGLDYFIANDLTHFDLRNTPGTTAKLPMGNRLNVQPGFSLPINRPYLYFTPRLQFAMTKYELGHVIENSTKNLGRGLPIFDVSSGLYFDRNVTLFNTNLTQTLEPQAYYTYIPYHNQNQIPIFDTTLNTLTYDQLFTYNRFSGLDRIGDANQIAIGVTTRFIDANSGAESIRAGIGEIIYFRNRLVTLCTDNDVGCPDALIERNNRLRRSPISGMIDYHLTPHWSLVGNSIWNTQTNNMDNQSIALHYSTETRHIINLGYNFVRNGDRLPDDQPDIITNSDNLKQVDLSFSWPVMNNWSTVGRWTKNVNRGRLQNLLYGLQYDSCCWAVRFVASRTFTHLGESNTPLYDAGFYFQFALKGLGNSPGNDPSQLLSTSITGYNANFGQDY
jgi:LPS-assembly protein